MNGDDATRELRARGFTRPIVALTAHALADVQAACLAAGADAYVTKPFRRDELLELIGRLTGH